MEFTAFSNLALELSMLHYPSFSLLQRRYLTAESFRSFGDHIWPAPTTAEQSRIAVTGRALPAKTWRLGLFVA